MKPNVTLTKPAQCSIEMKCSSYSHSDYQPLYFFGGFLFCFLSGKGTKLVLSHDCNAEKSKVTKLCRILRFLSCRYVYWGHLFQGRSVFYTLTNKFNVIFSKNPITLVYDEVSAFCCVNMPPNLVTLNISKMSYSVWYFETDILIDIRNL